MTARALFTWTLLAFVCVLIVRSMSLSPLGRVAPLWVLGPTAALLAVRLALDLFPRPGRGGARTTPEARPSRERVGSRREGDRLDVGAVGGPEWSPRPMERRRELRIAGWLTGLVALIYLFGFFLAVPAFLIPFLRLESGLRLWVAAAFSLVVLGALFLVFGLFADLSFPEGRILRMGG